MVKTTINGVEIEVYSIREMSNIVGVKSRALRRWEKQGILPESLVRRKMQSNHPGIGECLVRMYFYSQIEVLKKWLEIHPHGSGITFGELAIDELHKNWEIATDIELKKIKSKE